MSECAHNEDVDSCAVNCGIKCPPHMWGDRGTPGDYWRECWLCGEQEDA